MVERQVLWNSRKSNEMVQDDYGVDFIFVIVEDKRGIEKITQRIYTQFSNVWNIRPTVSECFNGTHGVRYSIIEFTAYNGQFNPRGVYAPSRMRKDEKLYDRTKDRDGLEKYVQGMLEKQGANL